MFPRQPSNAAISAPTITPCSSCTSSAPGAEPLERLDRVGSLGMPRPRLVPERQNGRKVLTCGVSYHFLHAIDTNRSRAVRGVRQTFGGSEGTSYTPLAVAERQHGVIKSSQLNMSSATIANWVRAGRLHPLYRGVFAYGHRALSREGNWMAAVLAAGDGAALAGLSSAPLHEITRWREREIEVIVPKQRRAQAGFRLRTCRNLDPRDLTVVNGIPVTTVARTLVDLTEVDGGGRARVRDPRGRVPEPVRPGRDGRRDERANGRRRIKVLEGALRIAPAAGAPAPAAGSSSGSGS